MNIELFDDGWLNLIISYEEILMNFDEYKTDLEYDEIKRKSKMLRSLNEPDRDFIHNASNLLEQIVKISS